MLSLTMKRKEINLKNRDQLLKKINIEPIKSKLQVKQNSEKLY